MVRRRSTSFVTVMNEEFHFPLLVPDVNSVGGASMSWADAFVSTHGLKKNSTDSGSSTVLFKSLSDSPQFSPTPPPSSPVFRRSSIVLTRSTSCPALGKPEEPPPEITRLPSWDDVREQFDHANKVAMHLGLAEEVTIRERQLFLSAWTLHSISSTFLLGSSK